MSTQKQDCVNRDKFCQDYVCSDNLVSGLTLLAAVLGSRATVVVLVDVMVDCCCGSDATTVTAGLFE